MLTLTNILLATNQLALALLLWRHWQLRRTALALRRRMDELPASNLSAAELAEVLGQGERELLAIEILNPMELAAKESWFADKFGSLTPRLVRKLVYERTAGILAGQMKDFGVHADVRLHRGA